MCAADDTVASEEVAHGEREACAGETATDDCCHGKVAGGGGCVGANASGEDDEGEDVGSGRRADHKMSAGCYAGESANAGCCADKGAGGGCRGDQNADQGKSLGTSEEGKAPAGAPTPAAESACPERSLDEIEGEIVELTVHIDAATSQLLRAISEFDRRKGWENGFLSCAHWLSWRTGMDLVTARERVRVARALDGLPLLDAAFREGKVSYSKVRAVIRIATPANEQDLTRLALDATASQMEKLARVYRTADLAQDPEGVRKQHRQRFLQMYEDDDGMLVIKGRLPPELGALFRKALDAAMEALREEQGQVKAKVMPACGGIEQDRETENSTPGCSGVAEPGAAFASGYHDETNGHDSAESPPAFPADHCRMQESRRQVGCGGSENTSSPPRLTGQGARNMVVTPDPVSGTSPRHDSAESRPMLPAVHPCEPSGSCPVVASGRPENLDVPGLGDRGTNGTPVEAPARWSGTTRQADSAESSEIDDEIGQLRADALGLLCEAALGKGLQAMERGEAWQILVHVDSRTLAGLNEGGLGEADDGQMVSAETCRRLACDSEHVHILQDSQGRVLHTGRKTRKISLPLWRALKTRDRACRFPGCNRSGRLVAHHIHHWAEGGETGPDNLVLLCRAHHWAVHEGGFTVRRGATGDTEFLRPDGSLFPCFPAVPAVDGVPLHGLKTLLPGTGSGTSPDVQESESHRSPLDYDLALIGLFSLLSATANHERKQGSGQFVRNPTAAVPDPVRV